MRRVPTNNEQVWCQEAGAFGARAFQLRITAAPPYISSEQFIACGIADNKFNVVSDAL